MEDKFVVVLVMQNILCMTLITYTLPQELIAFFQLTTITTLQYHLIYYNEQRERREGNKINRPVKMKNQQAMTTKTMARHEMSQTKPPIGPKRNRKKQRRSGCNPSELRPRKGQKGRTHYLPWVNRFFHGCVQNFYYPWTRNEQKGKISFCCCLPVDISTGFYSSINFFIFSTDSFITNISLYKFTHISWNAVWKLTRVKTCKYQNFSNFILILYRSGNFP